MIVQDLLDHFDQNVKLLHVDVNDVRDQLLTLGVQDKIHFHFVKMDPGKVRGILYRYSSKDKMYGTPILHSDVIIPHDMGDENEAWQRLVAVKELLHITDCDSLTAASPQAVDNLFVKFSMPPALAISSVDEPFSGSFLNDRVRIYFALAALIPAIPRDALRALYAKNKLTVPEIAQIAMVPERFVPHIMHENFDVMIGTLVKWELAEQIDDDCLPVPAQNEESGTQE